MPQRFHSFNNIQRAWVLRQDFNRSDLTSSFQTENYSEFVEWQNYHTKLVSSIHVSYILPIRNTILIIERMKNDCTCEFF